MFNRIEKLAVAGLVYATVQLVAVIAALGVADAVNDWQHPNDPSTDNYVQPVDHERVNDLLDGTAVLTVPGVDK